MSAWEPEEEYEHNPIIRHLKRLYQWLFPEPKEQQKGLHLGREKDFLCDSCKYNYGDVCARPERPNAKKCPDYKKS